MYADIEQLYVSSFNQRLISDVLQAVNDVIEVLPTISRFRDITK